MNQADGCTEEEPLFSNNSLLRTRPYHSSILDRLFDPWEFLLSSRDYVQFLENRGLPL
jgi:hypothetical protein